MLVYITTFTRSFVHNSDKPQHAKRSHGFTLLELMVATGVFAVVLLVLTAGVISFSRSYFSSVTRSNTQATSRLIIDDIAKTIQFGQSIPAVTTVGRTTVICLDNVQYLVAKGYQVSNTTNLSKHQNRYGAIKRSTASGCPAPADITTGSFAFNSATDHELLARNMRVSELDVQMPDDSIYTVRVRVAHGEDDLMGITGTPPSWSNINCTGGSGSQFCAISDLSTTVQQRITK